MRTNFLMHPLAHRLAWALAAGALVVMLALAACGGRTASPSANGNQATTSGATTSSGAGSASSSGKSNGSNNSNGNSAQQAQNADQQIQAALQAMDQAQSDANVDYSSQDNPVQP